MQLTDYSVCTNCYLTAAGYSEESFTRGPDEPTPLSLLPATTVNLFVGDEDDILHETFATSPCEGCGTDLAGGRESLTVVTSTP